MKNIILQVTGGSSGIGKCMAILAAKKGANVTIIARNVQNLEKAKQEILQARENKETQRVEYLSLDIAMDYETVEKALADLEKAMGPIYMLVNSAGLAIAGKIEDITIKNLDQMMRTNFLGTYYCIKAVTPRMKASRDGVIVLISSQAGLLGIYLIKLSLPSTCINCSLYIKRENAFSQVSLDTPLTAARNSHSVAWRRAYRWN